MFVEVEKGHQWQLKKKIVASQRAADADTEISSEKVQTYKIVHNLVRGRLRVSVPSLRYNAALKDLFEKELRGLASVKSVKVSAVTCSVLLVFDADRLIAGESLICRSIDSLVLKNQKNPKAILPFPEKKQPLEKSLRPSKDPVATAATQTEVESWHLMEREEVLARWKVRAKAGLSSSKVEKRLEEFGRNSLFASNTRKSGEILWEQFTSLPILLLVGSAGLSLVSGGAIEAGVILSLIGANALIGYKTESSAERTASLLENSSVSVVSVLRNKNVDNIAPEFLVPGDLVKLSAGMSVPADARLLEVHGLTVDESALTGESLPISKSAKTIKSAGSVLADRKNMVYRGTLVTGGTGFGVVVATGPKTELGKIQGLVNVTQNTKTPLQEQTTKMTNVLIYASSAMGLGLVGISSLYGAGLVQTLKLALSMTVAAIPEGLPVLVTITLAKNAVNIRKRNVLVRNLSAIETLGATEVLCLDKTGTLTQNLMSVVSVYAGMRKVEWNSNNTFLADELAHPKNKEFLRLLEVCVLNNDTSIAPASKGAPILEGSPTEKALINLALGANIDAIQLRERLPLIKTNYRTENKTYMLTEHHVSEDTRFLAVKGSPEQVLELCHWQMKEGRKILLTKAARTRILQENEEMGSAALRVLGLAYREVKTSDEVMPLIWLGLVGMKDLERPGARDLIRVLHEAGIKPIMITGDQSATASALALTLGIAGDEPLEVCDFSEVDTLTPEQLETLAQRAHVFSRVAPSEKLKIVQILQAQGRIVAMVGDGINDTPALKASHIGVAMGRRGADVAREVANVVILDDDLLTLVPAIEMGRTTFDSIKKAVLFLLSTNFSETLLMLGGAVLGLGHALTPLQILWINLISDLFPALALAMEPADSEVLKRGPRDPKEALMTARDFRRVGGEAGVMALLSLGAFAFGTARYGRGHRAQSMAFVTLTSAQLLHTFSSRSTEHSIFKRGRLPANKYVPLSVVSGFALQTIPVAIPTIRRLFGLAPLGLADLLVCAGFAGVNYVFNEAYRAFFGSKRSSKLNARPPQIAIAGSHNEVNKGEKA